jgi:hypothetical protein
MNWTRLGVSLIGLLAGASAARAEVTLLLEEPFGTFGGMNPTGHAAVYLSRVCADSPHLLRLCHEGEQGVVISRYHRVGGYDWLAIPVIPYLYAVDRAEDVPEAVDDDMVAALRDEYRRKHLEAIVPDESDGGAPEGDWIQLVGSAYDRTIYTFGIQTTEAQDVRFIKALNSRPNRTQFSLLFKNCADFARKTINFYYPKAIHRSLIADVGIMTPKQAAKSLVHYTKRHDDLRLSSFIISQVPGTVPRSHAVRGVLESLTRSKKYAVPLASLAVLHPVLGGSLAFAWMQGLQFDPRQVASVADSPVEPAQVAEELHSPGASQ